MRIDTLRVKNFKLFEDQTFTFDPHFTLLVGENGSGKTSLLDALAVALGVWLIHAPDMITYRRPIRKSEARLVPVPGGDRTLRQVASEDVFVQATGRIMDQEPVSWLRRFVPGQLPSDNSEAHAALGAIKDAFRRARASEMVVLPIIAYYGAGRAWAPREKQGREIELPTKPPGRWDALRRCLDERISPAKLNNWFLGEAIARLNRGGTNRPGFEVVRGAVLRCIPEADDVSYDGDRREVVLSIAKNQQPYSNLSAGQRMMLAMVADIAIKAVMHNNFLVPPDVLGPEDEPLPRVLKETPGVVLIDELDVHLHPRWQRRVIHDLKAIFPKIQFIATTHSPQVIGEALPQEIRLLGENGAEQPGQSFGMDSNWILRTLMGADEQDQGVRERLDRVHDLISQRLLDEARAEVDQLRRSIGNNAAIQKAISTIDRVRVLGK